MRMDVCGRKVQLSGGCGSGSEQSVCKHGEAVEGISCSWWNGDLAEADPVMIEGERIW